MSGRRRPPDLVTPAYEDSGIFKQQVIQIAVQVLPQFGQNMRNDLVIKGFVEGKGTIDLIFPGRRKNMAHTLQRQINAEWQKACALAKQQGTSMRIEDFRFDLKVEGAWRPRFYRDEDGSETRNFQLYAARWAYTDAAGITIYCGESVAR